MSKKVIYAGVDSPLTREGKAVSDIAPGTFLKETADGLDVNDIEAVVFGEPLLVADKDQLRSKSVDDAWAIGENMVGILPRSGEIINALVATGQTLIVGSPLARNGSGLLKLAATPASVSATSEEIACFSDEAITTTATTLVRVRAA